MYFLNKTLIYKLKSHINTEISVLNYKILLSVFPAVFVSFLNTFDDIPMAVVASWAPEGEEHAMCSWWGLGKAGVLIIHVLILPA